MVGNTALQEGQPKDETPSGGEDAPRKSGPTATHEVMTPESTGQVGADRQTQQGYAPDQPSKSTDELRREQADINTYRAHFSGYQDDSAHISSNPFVESDNRLKGLENQHNTPGKAIPLPSTPLSGPRFSSCSTKTGNRKGGSVTDS